MSEPQQVEGEAAPEVTSAADGSAAKPEKKAAKSSAPTTPTTPTTAGASLDKSGSAPTTSANALPAKIAYPLAVLCGFLYFLAFPGVDFWPISFIALAPLFVALRGQTPKRALGLGWAAGFTMTMCGFYWLLEMLRVFSGFGPVLCFVFMAILCAYQAGRIAFFGWLHGRATVRGWPAAPVAALAFVGSELAFPLLFPWYYGATVHNAVLFAQVADLGGGYLVGLVLVAANLGIAELICARLGLANGTGTSTKQPDRRVLAVAALVPLLAAAYGYLRLRMVDAQAAAAEPVKIGIVQGNMPLIGRRQALKVHTAHTAELKQKGVDLVVWSEGSTGMANRETPDYDEVRRAVTDRLGVPTIVGALLARSEGKRYKYFNTALLSDRSGKILGRYDKQYLLAFGEYLPFGETFPVLYEMSPNSSQFSPGKSIDPLVFGEHKISTLICYEDILPGFVNGMVQHANPDLLVNLTNDAWFGESTEPWIHMALAKMRAIEHRRYLVRGTNSGVSVIVDPVGRVALHGGTFKEESLIGVAKWMRGKTLYEIIGDAPWILATLAILGMAFLSRDRVMQAVGKRA
ncbi:Apolipoprotein N-acyltransferase [Minicystis rosea]|nr:Apolipoprotein N-acyltransferase [Minicystis rosea]